MKNVSWKGVALVLGLGAGAVLAGIFAPEDVRSIAVAGLLGLATGFLSKFGAFGSGK